MADSSLTGLTPDEALVRLRDGNLRFLAGDIAPALRDPGSHRFVAAAQAPFAALLACADSRVAPEILFSCGLGDLFVVRNAGNVMSDVASGSIDFTLEALNDSVRAIVVMGHTGCGAVKGAVASYLNPTRYWSKSISPHLRIILQRIFVAVRESDRAIRRVWGADASARAEFVEALTEASVHLNAAYTAFELRRQVEASCVEGIEVFHAVYDVRSHLIRTPPRKDDPEGGRQGLTLAVNEPEELSEMARETAEALRPA